MTIREFVIMHQCEGDPRWRRMSPDQKAQWIRNCTPEPWVLAMAVDLRKKTAKREYWSIIDVLLEHRKRYSDDGRQVSVGTIDRLLRDLKKEE